MESMEPVMKKPRGYEETGNGIGSWNVSSIPGVNTTMNSNMGTVNPAVNYAPSNPNPNLNPTSNFGGSGVSFSSNPNPNLNLNGGSYAMGGPMGGGAYENNGAGFVGGFHQHQQHQQGFNNGVSGFNNVGDLECRRYNTPDGCPYGVNCRFKHGPNDDRDLSHQMPSVGGKTKPCMKFFSTSGCPYGESCHFLHYVQGGINALGLGPVQTMPNTVIPPPRRQAAPAADPSLTVNGYKTKLCNRFNTAEGCRFGDKCHFAHGESDLRPSNNVRQANRAMPNEVPMQVAPAAYNNGPPTSFPNTAGYGDTVAYGNSAAYSGNTFAPSQGYVEPTPPGVAANAAFVPNYNTTAEQPPQFVGNEATIPAGPFTGPNVHVY